MQAKLSTANAKPGAATIARPTRESEKKRIERQRKRNDTLRPNLGAGPPSRYA